MKTTESLAIHIKYKDNLEEAFFIPLKRFSLTVNNNKVRLELNHPIQPIERDLFFCNVLYTDDPKCHPKGLIINLGYIVLRVRLTMCKVISTNPFIIETDVMDNFLFQWKLPLRVPTLLEGSKTRIRDLGIPKQGGCKFEWGIYGDNQFDLTYTFFIPEAKQGYELNFWGNMDSLYNKLIESKPTKLLKREPKVLKL